MNEAITKLENDIALLNAARYADGPNKGARVVEVDRPYARDVFAKQVQLAEAKAAEGKQVRINEHQLHGLGRWDREHNKPDHQILTAAHRAKPELRAEIEAARANVFDGQRPALSPALSAVIAQVKAGK